MKVKDLQSILKDFDPDDEVYLAEEGPSFQFFYHSIEQAGNHEFQSEKGKVILIKNRHAPVMRPEEL